ncbi:GIY-YIG nuclease family protein [Pseudomonadota bacterium]
MSNNYSVYILTNKKYGKFYTGITNNLPRRIEEHKEKIIKGYTAKYDINKLVYYEVYEDVCAAIWREKIIKKWKRSIKFDAIERMNPDWNDLYFELNE